MPPDRHDVLLRKASQDELVLERLLGDSDVDDDTLGFHAQQAAEKLLKAALAARALDYLWAALCICAAVYFVFRES
jgi:HEPN domain-containing protein